MRKVVLIAALSLAVVPYTYAQNIGDLFNAVKSASDKPKKKRSSDQEQAQPQQQAEQQPSAQAAPQAAQNETATTAPTKKKHAPEYVKEKEGDENGFACKGDKWLGIEEPFSCATMTSAICEQIDSKSEFAARCVGIITDPSNNQIDTLGRLRIKPAIDKAGLLGDAITETEITKKIASISGSCNAMFPSKETVQAASGYVYCTRATLAVLGLNVTLEQRRGACSSTLLTPPVKAHCLNVLKEALAKESDAIDKWRLASAREDAKYMETTGEPAKTKLDSLISAGERDSKKLSVLCPQYAKVLSLRENEFVPKCQQYILAALDKATGGQASKKLATDNKTEDLSNVFLLHRTVETCHYARRDFKVKLITDTELEQATAAASRAERSLTASGANKDQAKKMADERSGMLNVARSDTSYSDNRKNNCQGALMTLTAFR